jgi:hypothetical protein
MATLATCPNTQLLGIFGHEGSTRNCRHVGGGENNRGGRRHGQQREGARYSFRCCSIAARSCERGLKRCGLAAAYCSRHCLK